LLIDSNGFLWVGTQQGLFKFEGKDVLVFDNKDRESNQLDSSDIRGIVQRKNGDLIVATFGGGLYELAQDSTHFKSINIEHDLELKDLYTATDDYLLATGKRGFFGLDLSKSDDLKWLTKNLLKERISDVVDSIIVNEDRTLIATDQSILQVSISEQSIKSNSLNIPDEKITSIAFSSPNEIYVSTSFARVHSISIQDFKVKSTLDLSRQKVGNISDLIYLDNRLWVATDNGLFVASKDLLVKAHLNQSNSKLSNNNITRMLYENGILFVGTYNGLNQIVPSSIRSFNHQNSNIDNDILAFAQSSAGNLWVGTYSGLYKYDRPTEKHLNFFAPDESPLPDSRITTIASQDNVMWVGLAQHGVHRIDTLTGDYKSFAYAELAELEVTKILVTQDNRVFVSSYSDGLFEIKDESLISMKTAGERSFNQLFETSKGVILASTERQLFLLDKSNNVFVEFDISFPETESKPPLLLSMAENSKGDLLLGTKGRGIFMLPRALFEKGTGKIRSVGADRALSSSTVYGMVLDRNSNLWCSTQQGVFKISPEELVEFRLTKLDGLQANDFNFGATFKDSDGNLYFGGINGYSLLDPERSRPVNKKSPLAITEVSLGHDHKLPFNQVSHLRNLRLSNEHRFLSITVNLLDYQNPDANQYTYKLEGFDKSWVEAGTNNTATYTNLEPGEYTFRARGANAAGIWSENEVSLNIIVMPPWWKTLWAYGCYGFLAILSLWAVMRIYRNHLLKEEALRIAQQMHDAADQAHDDLQENQEYQDELVRAVSQHNLATLELISQCFEESGGEDSSPTKVLGHIKALELLEKSYFFEENSLVADMHAYVDGLINLLLTQIDIDPAKITTINRVTRETLPARIASPLAIIIYELLHNSLTHAFPANTVSNFVEVSLDISRDSADLPTLALTVADDGVGVPVLQADGANVRTGLRVVRELSRALDPEYTMMSDNGSKTRITLHIPGPLN
jgi:ligand-binding sensor domain-containing protein/two-component sensor histidine kinase